MRQMLVAVVLCLATLVSLGTVASYTALAEAVPEMAPLQPAIVSREMWQAKPPIGEMTPQRIAGIILHHTGTLKKPEVPIKEKMRGLQGFSQRTGRLSNKRFKPAWPDVPYHFYIDAGGRIAEGRDIHFAGDTNTGYDTKGYIQIAVEGDFEVEIPDPAQLTALRDLLAWLELSWKLDNNAVSVHKDHAPTSCPGRNFMTLLPGVLANVALKIRR